MLDFLNRTSVVAVGETMLRSRKKKGTSFLCYTVASPIAAIVGSPAEGPHMTEAAGVQCMQCTEKSVPVPRLYSYLIELNRHDTDKMVSRD